MEKLTIKELAPYLPYGLFVQSNRGGIYLMDIYSNMSGSGVEKREVSIVLNEEMKPILRPLSDLTKEIEHNGEKLVPSNEFENLYLNEVKWGDNSIGTGILGENGDMIDLCFINNGIVGECPLAIYELLIEWKFDVFGLLDKNSAVPVTENFNHYK